MTVNTFASVHLDHSSVPAERATHSRKMAVPAVVSICVCWINVYIIAANKPEGTRRLPKSITA